MQNLRFGFSDSSDCPAEKGGVVLAKGCNVIYCNVTFFCLGDSASIAPALVVTCDLAEKDTHS